MRRRRRWTKDDDNIQLLFSKHFTSSFIWIGFKVEQFKNTQLADLSHFKASSSDRQEFCRFHSGTSVFFGGNKKRVTLGSQQKSRANLNHHRQLGQSQSVRANGTLFKAYSTYLKCLPQRRRRRRRRQQQQQHDNCLTTHPLILEDEKHYGKKKTRDKQKCQKTDYNPSNSPG